MLNGFDILLFMKNTKSIKSEFFAVRLYPEDMERLNTTADELGVSTSRLVRLLIHYTSPRIGPAGQSAAFRKWVNRVTSRPLF